MIHRIFSDLPSFKELEFRPGLNVLLAKKELGAQSKQTRNRAGKTSTVETVHFLTGAKVEKGTLFASKSLEDVTFGIDLDLPENRIRVTRSTANRSRIELESTPDSIQKRTEALSNSEWMQRLGLKYFGLGTNACDPTFRSLFAYFVRRELSGAFRTPEKQASMQQAVDYQKALLYLLDLDWTVADRWQSVRDKEKSLKEIRKAAKNGSLGRIIGKTSELRTDLAIAENKLKGINQQITEFQVLEAYRDLEAEANSLTGQLKEFSDQNSIDLANISELEGAIESESPPTWVDLEAIYKEAGVVLPKTALMRFDEVASFHDSVVSNRREYLQSELRSVQSAITARRQQMESIDERRGEILRLLRSHGALEQFQKLQEEGSRLKVEVEDLRKRFEAAEQIEGTKSELEIERNSLLLELRRAFSEQSNRLNHAIVAYEEVSKQLYESAGSMAIEPSSNGPVFNFPMQGSRSKGIRNMQIFCFDMMLMRLCSERGIGPGFLIHDSHLFDGVDGRQVIRALKVGASMADKMGFQYIVTLNEDDAFKESETDFNLKDYVLPTVLTDATEDGGLFGFRF